jgi:hypothetical protein
MLRKKLQCISPEREKVIILHQDLTQPGWGEGYVKCYANKFSELWNLVPNKKIRNRRNLGYAAHFDFVRNGENVSENRFVINRFILGENGAP